MTNETAQEIHKRVREECFWLCTCYNTFNALFDSDSGTEQLLRRTAELFFTELNRIYVDYYTILVARLTDPEQSGGHRNLTVKALDSTLNDMGLLTPEMEELSKRIHAYRKLVQDARRKAVAHLDRNITLSGETFGEHRREEMIGFFDDLQRYMDATGIAVGNGPRDFRTTSAPGDVLDLIRALECRETN